MVEFRVKVGSKGQILIPKVFRDRYGIEEGRLVIIEPIAEGILVKGRPPPELIMSRLEEHAKKVRDMGVRGPSLGELKEAYLEAEFEGRGG